MACFAIAATIFLIHSHAATSASSVEAENGTLSGNAAKVADSGASGGSAVRFQGASNDPNNIAIDPSVGGVPIPKTGLYWGGIEKKQAPGATVPGCTTQAWPEMECKITWAATQTYPTDTGTIASQRGTAVNPTHAAMSSDGTYHSSLDHFFYTDCSNAPDADFKPGGQVYKSAHTPGRKVILIDMKCGSTWSVLGNGGGNTASDAKLKELTPLIDSIGVPVIWSIYDEPENDICGQNSNEGTPDQFRAMFRQAVADIRSQHPKNISTALTLQGADVVYWSKHGRSNNNTVFTSCSMSNLTDAERNPNNFYPGDDAVDFLTFQEYDHDTGDFQTSYQIQLDWMHTACPTTHPTTNYSCTTAVRSAKPTGSSEWGISGSRSFRDTYFTNMVTELPNLPQIKYLSYWSSQDDPKFPDYIDYPYQTPDTYYGSGNTTLQHDDYGTDTTHLSLKAWTTLSLSPYVYNPQF